MKRSLVVFIVLCLILSLIKGCEGKTGGKGGKTSVPAAIPSGVYWATYSNIPDAPEASTGVATAERLYYVRRVEIGEPSTAEIIASVEFPEGVNSAAAANPNDHSQYWVERIQNSEGKTTSIKLASTAANNFYLNISLYTLSLAGTPAMNVSLMSDDGVHSPDGTVLSDPYKDPELPIAGFKNLRFKGSYKQGTKIRESVEQAGYPASSVRYQNGEYSFDTTKEIVGRAKIEEAVLKPERWEPDDSITKGNVGLYNYSDGFTGKITLNWTFLGVPFTVEINDAKLETCDDGEDQTTYTLSGTAEISMKSFSIEGIVYKLNENQRKPFSEEGSFIVLKTPKPAVHWYYSESWEYVNDFGTGFLIGPNFLTGKSLTDFDYVPVADLDDIDGTYNMSFMMPGYGGTATWTFKPDNR